MGGLRSKKAWHTGNMQTILLSISFANFTSSTYSKERSKKLADSISSLSKKVSCYFSKTDIGQKKGVSSLLSESH